MGLGIENFFDLVIIILMVITVAFTLSSGIFYLWTNRGVVFNAKAD